MTPSTITAQNDMSDILGLAALSERERESMLEGIGELIMESVMTRAVADMSDADAEAFAAEVATCADPEALIAALQKRVPDIDRLIQEESDAFRAECIDLVNRVRA